MATGADRGKRLEFVEVGRGLAALAVVVFHANASAKFFGGPDWYWPDFLAHGVDFFFVLSGFVILHAHARDIGHRDRLYDYAAKRAVRLLPTLWLVVIGWTLLRWAGGATVDVTVVFGSLLPYPSLQSTLPLVVWTLRHEVVFYVLFAVLLLSRRLGLMLLVAWMCLVVAQFMLGIAGRPTGGLPAFFLAGYSADFLLGMGVYLLQRRTEGAAPSPLPLGLGLLLLFVIAWAMPHEGLSRTSLTDYQSAAATWGALVLGVGFAAVLYGLVRLEGWMKAPRALLALGASSYALYLIHTPANSITQRAAEWMPVWLKAIGAGHLLLVVVGVVLGWLLHRYAEKPIIAHLRPWLLRSRRDDPSCPIRLPDSQSTASQHLR